MSLYNLTKMGIAFSMVSKSLRNFNVESRAHKVISQPKPVPAPKHKNDEEDLQRLIKEYPQIYQDSLKKDIQLDTRLRDIYVTSQEPNINVKQKPNPNRPLPVSRTTEGPYLYGVKEPEHIPLGKITLERAMEFITKHQNDPKLYNSKKISEEYSIPEENAKNILKFVRVLEVYTPIERQPKAKFAGPSLPKIQILKQIRKELPAPSQKKSEKT